MKKKGFTLIELIAVLVILAIIALIVTPLVMSIIRKAKISARKRSVDAYGRSVELAIASYLMDTGTFPTNEQLPNLKIEYSGNKVECNVMNMKQNGGLYLSQCKVNNIEVKDSNEEDGYYHYGTRDLTNSEIVDVYVKALEDAIKKYHDINNTYPNSIDDLSIDYSGENVECNINFNYDGTFYIDGCSVSGINVDYKKGVDKSTAVKALLANKNDVSITNYTDGDIHEVYTFEHPETVQTPALTDYRYIGNNPYNYVTFNNELWRIIGVFTVEDKNGNTEERLKIVRNEKLANNMPWDLSGKYGQNEWSSATLNSYLNGEYYNGIDELSKNMISDTKYYLGGNVGYSGGAETYYNFERGTRVYSGRSTAWIGKVALIYPSDNYYTYALGIDNTCYTDSGKCSADEGAMPTNSWIYNTNSNSQQWLLSPRSDYTNVFLIDHSGVFVQYYAYGLIGIRPTLYLSSQVKMISGTGKSDDPYNLSL